MTHLFRFILAAALATLFMTADASASSKFPLVQCGPGLAYLCRLHGYFNDAPFQYDLAIHPGCLRRERVRTPYGVRYEDVLVCGTGAPHYMTIY